MRHAGNCARVFMRGVDEHHAGNLAGIRMVIKTNEVAAEGVAHQDQRPLEARVANQRVQIAGRLIAPRRIRAGVAPPDVGSIVPADVRESRDTARLAAPVSRDIRSVR